MRSSVKSVNIEKGWPTVDIAEKRTMFEISTSKREGVKVLKVIHGYGSTGTGGKIKEAVTKLLNQKKKEGTIKAFVGGEEWDIFNQATRNILENCNEMRKDKDLGNHNLGITIILL